MNVANIIEFVAQNRGITNSATIYAFLNQAMQEIWNAVDFPGTLREENFKPYDTLTGYITLPYYMQAVRGICPCKRMSTDLMDQATAVMDDQYIYSPWRWRHRGKTPLIRNIAEASQLTIKRQDLDNTEEVIISLGGSSDVADSAQEAILLPSTASEITTVKSYETLEFLNKNVITECNLDVYDSAGNKVAVLPNHFLDVHNLIIQILDDCQSTVLTLNCVKILYKPYLPPMLRETDVIPEFMEQPLYYKLLEWLDLHTGDKLDRAQLMSLKSATLLDQAAFTADRGQNKPINFRRNPFQPYAGYRI